MQQLWGKKKSQANLTSANLVLMFHHLAGGSCHTPTRTWFPRLPAWPPGSGSLPKPGILQPALDYHANLTIGLRIGIPEKRKKDKIDIYIYISYPDHPIPGIFPVLNISM